MPHVPVNEEPGFSLIRASPVRNAFGGQVIGSTARLRRPMSGSGSKTHGLDKPTTRRMGKNMLGRCSTYWTGWKFSPRPDLLLRSETHGDYRIVAAMPDRDGDHMYRIKSPLEEYERVVKEDLLVKSTGYLPEEAAARVLRHSSITLPTL